MISEHNIVNALIETSDYFRRGGIAGFDSSGTKFTQQHNLPLWVGEFGSVFNGPADEAGDRLRALDDQLSIFEHNDAHRTTWNYKEGNRR